MSYARHPAKFCLFPGKIILWVKNPRAHCHVTTPDRSERGEAGLDNNDAKGLKEE